VITIAGLCDAIQDDTGLVAAITMGIVLANLRGVHLPEDRPFLKTVVQLAIGVLFNSISATVTPASLQGVIWPALGLVACLVLLVRPAVAVVAPVRTSLTRNERIFVGSMDPPGSSLRPLQRASPPRSSRSASAGRTSCCPQRSW
jgi:NhaP-type Na+/H+ or K+/H+ antiporter